MQTKFGPEAQNGDYVLVLDVSKYFHSKNLIAKVYNDKAYTGVKHYNYSSKGAKYIHKLGAEIVIPESIVPADIKAQIEEDITIHNKTN